jgi:hypothetical protein
MRSSRILPLFAAIASLAIITVAGFGDAVEVTLLDDEVHAARFHDGVSMPRRVACSAPACEHRRRHKGPHSDAGRVRSRCHRGVLVGRVPKARWRGPGRSREVVSSRSGGARRVNVGSPDVRQWTDDAAGLIATTEITVADDVIPVEASPTQRAKSRWSPLRRTGAAAIDSGENSRSIAFKVARRST